MAQRTNERTILVTATTSSRLAPRRRWCCSNNNKIKNNNNNNNTTPTTILIFSPGGRGSGAEDRMARPGDHERIEPRLERMRFPAP
mmetsp:Transcript_24626/g.52487  ORF Transcript_24626/g.52487 Transcript_24626/m.52487 type:complete len:86 (+) Transcript_24626:158-415(+)|eukprot:CAMPEP_0201176998 /NCGR_PEP_ID=MMETSP0851-20130426/106243_1 /ASSEMBLY_ACC=CAM_ASM_000631 /TAXON_ID=183588 /ORGANISM="Pseudo-nitzschia fraudulenta, Strain WWA7" /LENGTH=85 /DNA_ID=CAMNT_0047460495 /DNA_START=208 /DNA_END=465 /DNA_ORIENTATION=+